MVATATMVHVGVDEKINMQATATLAAMGVVCLESRIARSDERGRQDCTHADLFE